MSISLHPFCSLIKLLSNLPVHERVSSCSSEYFVLNTDSSHVLFIQVSHMQTISGFLSEMLNILTVKQCNSPQVLGEWILEEQQKRENAVLKFYSFSFFMFSFAITLLIWYENWEQLELKDQKFLCPSFCFFFELYNWNFSLAPFQPSIHSKTDRYQIQNNRRRTIKLLACCTLRSRKGKEKILEVQPTRKKLQNSTIKALFLPKLGNNLNCATSVRFNFAVKCVFFSSEVAGYYRSISHQTSPAW